ncbi:MAG: YfhO family protein, partial [Nitrospinota bacterium]|nr:YfhO family protein [Nitrospinota bacterium]
VLAAGRTTIPYGQAGYHKIQIVNGYNPVNISRYIEFTDVIRDKTNALPIKWLDFTEVQRMPLLDFLNVKYIVTNKPINDGRALKLIYHENAEVFNFYAGMERVSLNLYKNMNSLPRAYIVNNVKTIDGPSENVKKALEKLDPYITAIIEKPVPPQFKELAFTEDTLNGNGKEVFIKKVEIESYGNDEIKLKTSLDQKGFMVFSDLYYPGWELCDNGKRVDIFRTNYSFRGVFLDRGNHDLLFKFNPKPYTRGAIVSLISGILVFIVLIRCNVPKVIDRKYCIF